MRILIIRHAEPDFPNDRLTAKGRREAELLSERAVAKVTVCKHTSTLARCLRKVVCQKERCSLWKPLPQGFFGFFLSWINKKQI